MSSDPIERIADEHFIELAADLQVQLEKGTGTRPVLWLLSEARKRAVSATFALTKIDPMKTDDIRHLQNEISLYDDMIQDCKNLMSRGKEADRRLHERDREELQGVVMADDDRELFGLEPMGSDR